MNNTYQQMYNALLLLNPGSYYPVSAIPPIFPQFAPTGPHFEPFIHDRLPMPPMPEMTVKPINVEYKIKVFFGESKSNPQEIAISMSNTGTQQAFLLRFIELLDISSGSLFDLYLLQNDGSNFPLNIM